MEGKYIRFGDVDVKVVVVEMSIVEVCIYLCKISYLWFDINYLVLICKIFFEMFYYWLKIFNIR